MIRSIQRKDIAGVFGAAVLLLLVPFIAMQFTKQVNWSPSDFVIMGALLSVTGIAIVAAARKIGSANTRIAVIVAIVLTFLITWGELAVGIFGTPFAGS